MSGMTYTTLVAAKTVAGSIKRAVNYDKIDVEAVLEEAQTLIYSALRVREMRVTFTKAIVVGDATAALPADFLDPLSAYIYDNKNIKYHQVTEDVFFARSPWDSDGVLTSGLPSCWTILDELIQFDMKFDEARTIFLPYYKKPALLSGTVTTNFLCTRYPHLLRQACRISSHSFMKNWTGYNADIPAFSAMIDRANVEADLSRYGADIEQEV